MLLPGGVATNAHLAWAHEDMPASTSGLAGSSLVLCAQQHSHACGDGIRRLLRKAVGRHNRRRAAHAAALAHCARLPVCGAEPQVHHGRCSSCICHHSWIGPAHEGAHLFCWEFLGTSDVIWQMAAAMLDSCWRQAPWLLALATCPAAGQGNSQHDNRAHAVHALYTCTPWQTSFRDRFCFPAAHAMSWFDTKE